MKIDNESIKFDGLGSDLKFDWNDDLSTLRSSIEDDNIEQIDQSVSLLRKTKFQSLSNNHQYSEEQYEELIKQTPNDSHLWIEYMQFYLDQAEIDRARTVAERALTNIFYRYKNFLNNSKVLFSACFSEESDKLNVWIAYLALENRHGTPDKVNSILTRALGNCDGMKIYQRLACDVYEKNEQYEVKYKKQHFHSSFFLILFRMPMLYLLC